MPRNGSGQYIPLTNTWNPPVTGVLATGADFQAQLTDIAAAITQSLSKDGQTSMIGNLPMNNNNIVGLASGTAAAPSISPTGDTNTGVYFPAVDQVAISTGGVQRVMVNSDGHVGIGTSTPGDAFTLSLGNARIQKALPELRFRSPGDVKKWFICANISDSVDGGLLFGAGEGVSTGTTHMRIDSSGNLLINATTSFANLATNTLQVQGSIGGQLLLRHTASASGKYWRIGPDNFDNNLVVYNQGGIGVYISDGSTSWASSSDERLKTSLTPIEGAIKKVCAIRAVTGRYLTDDESISRAFFIAQDFEKSFPEPVSKQNNEHNTLGLCYTETIPLAFAAIQEQQALIEKQQSLIESLVARIAALEAK